MWMNRIKHKMDRAIRSLGLIPLLQFFPVCPQKSHKVTKLLNMKMQGLEMKSAMMIMVNEISWRELEIGQFAGMTFPLKMDPRQLLIVKVLVVTECSYCQNKKKLQVLVNLGVWATGSLAWRDMT